MPQGKQTPNIGQLGVQSIRIAGMKVDDLPIAEGAIAKMQLPIAEEEVRKNLIEAIKARYPKQDVMYLQARVAEARGMIARFREQMNRVGGEREKYRILLHDAKEREKKIKAAEKLLSGDELKEEIKSLTREYGPWQLEGLRAQIDQFSASIKRFEEVIEREQASIDELTELLGLCRARDKELTRLGA